MKIASIIVSICAFALNLSATAQTADPNKIVKMTPEKLTLTTEWDKTFPQTPDVDHSKVTFVNRYGITLAADMYKPKGKKGPFAAIAVCGPFGAVKEQASGLYAQEMAKRGFLTIAFDPSFTGESGGQPRYVSSPDINTEDFSAAVDFLVTNPEVDPERVGIIGICGWGGIALNAASSDPRIKATVASTMYDMSRVKANGYFDAADTAEDRDNLREQLAKQRTEDYKNGIPALAGGLPDERPSEPLFVAQYWDYYKTPRGYHKRSLNSNGGWNVTATLPWINFPLMSRLGEVKNAVMIVHGEKAHSFYFGHDAYEKLNQSESDYTHHNKLFMAIPGATHTDLYDNYDFIPFDSIEYFFNEYIGNKK